MGLFRGRVGEEAAAYAAAALPRLTRIARNLTHDQADAEDLVQDTLIKVMTNWERVAVAEGPDAYVRKVMVNTFISGKRLRRSTEVVSHEIVTADRYAVHADVASGQAERDALWSRLADLSRAQRAVLVLRYYEDLPDVDIASTLDMSPGNVRVTAHRALTALRESAPTSGETLLPR